MSFTFLRCLLVFSTLTWLSVGSVRADEVEHSGPGWVATWRYEPWDNYYEWVGLITGTTEFAETVVSSYEGVLNPYDESPFPSDYYLPAVDKSFPNPFGPQHGLGTHHVQVWTNGSEIRAYPVGSFMAADWLAYVLMNGDLIQTNVAPSLHWKGGDSNGIRGDLLYSNPVSWASMTNSSVVPSEIMHSGSFWEETNRILSVNEDGSSVRYRHASASMNTNLQAYWLNRGKTNRFVWAGIGEGERYPPLRLNFYLNLGSVESASTVRAQSYGDTDARWWWENHAQVGLPDYGFWSGGGLVPTVPSCGTIHVRRVNNVVIYRKWGNAPDFE